MFDGDSGSQTGLAVADRDSIGPDAAGEALAIAAERDAPDRPRVRHRLADELACLHVPQVRLGIAPSQQMAAIGAEGQRQDARGMFQGCAAEPAVADSAEMDQPIKTAGGEKLAIRAEGSRGQARSVAPAQTRYLRPA